MTPTRPPVWPSRPSATTTVIGIVGPAFSGESEAADPIFNEAGLLTITASATQPDAGRARLEDLPPVLGNDASQGPAAANYIKDVLKAKKVVRRRRRLRVRQGPGRHRQEDLGDAVVGNDTIQTEQTDFSADRHQDP